MNLFDKLNSNICIPPFNSKKGDFVVDDTIGISLLLAAAYRKKPNKYLLITSNLYKSQKIYSFLTSFINKEDILIFPGDELIRAETLASNKELISHRLFTLDKIVNNEAMIVICNVSSATRFLPSPELFIKSSISLKVGDKYDISKLKEMLVKTGYIKVNKIDQSLEFASRGDILDVFSINEDNPIRIEFFDDEIESIRHFDISSQKSIDNISSIRILPATDMLLDNLEQENISTKIFDILQKDKEFLDYSKFEILRNNVEEVIFNFKEYNFLQKNYKYYSLLQNKKSSIFDYCKGFVRVFADKESILTSNKLLFEESFTYLEELTFSNKCITHLEMYQDINNLVNIDSKFNIITDSFLTNGTQAKFNVRLVPYQANKIYDCLNIIHSYLNDNYQIVICLNNSNQINTIKELLEKEKIGYEKVKEYNLPDKYNIAFSLLNLNCGFDLIDEKVVYLTAVELFNEKIKTSRVDNRFKEAIILRSYEDLNPGDYVVHEYRGIGQFLQLETIETDGVKKDYIKILYGENEKLYVPLSQFHLIRKFQGKEGHAPRLSKLNGKDWENTKRKIKERINNLAERLINLYSQRSQIKGFQFQKDDEFQNQFEKEFEYELTDDQKKAVKEIKADMESPTPMDRLLCGDVGFGKTEVAFIAAFKAINSGKQVAMLCPTTLLARQHYEVAVKRFSNFGINIAIFSRLVPEKIQLQYIKDIKEGKIHFAIGTHRLLSKDIVFNDLGLLIVDEEQRFGVEQKERLKELKTNIDVLTLSATPIPRTLQISLMGVRSLSKISTPPNQRVSIQTYVTPYRSEVVKELIERELSRNGQIFYLHNNIDDLYIVANKLQRLIPNVSIGVAHGKMSRDEIENVMLKFYSGEISLLVCTSIIENGIDVPNANLIIVEDSESYGLAQLYQIKGRVGRSDRISYAYLMFNEHKKLNDKAKKRLQVLQDFTELGSGYKIAQRDLMIRGAGDILGPEQAGFIDSIGLDMYIKLLNETIKEKLGEEIKEESLDTTTLQINSYIPSEFANDSEKIELYQDILNAPSLDVLDYVKEKVRDTFGKLPNSVDLIFKKRHIELLAEESRIKQMKDNINSIELVLGKDFCEIKGVGNILFEMLIPYLSIIKVSYVNNVFKIYITKKNNWIDDLEKILVSIKEIIEKNRVIEI